MKEDDYAAIVAALDRALAEFDAHPALFGPDRELRDKLFELRETISARRGAK